MGRHLLKNLKELRERVGLTQAQVAESLGTAVPAVSAFERRAHWRTSTLKEYGEAIGVEVRIEFTLKNGERIYLDPED